MRLKKLVFQQPRLENVPEMSGSELKLLFAFQSDTVLY